MAAATPQVIDTRTVGKLPSFVGRPESWNEWVFRARAWLTLLPLPLDITSSTGSASLFPKGPLPSSMTNSYASEGHQGAFQLACSNHPGTVCLSCGKRTSYVSATGLASWSNSTWTSSCPGPERRTSIPASASSTFSEISARGEHKRKIRRQTLVEDLQY